MYPDWEGGMEGEGERERERERHKIVRLLLELSPVPLPKDTCIHSVYWQVRTFSTP